MTFSLGRFDWEFGLHIFRTERADWYGTTSPENMKPKLTVKASQRVDDFLGGKVFITQHGTRVRLNV